MELTTLHAQWQEKWAAAKLYEPEPRPAPGASAAPAEGKFFLTAAFPYPNSPQHIGHARTYTTTDIYARFMRMAGKNVLFPMAFHVTGTPILGMAKRIEAKDPELFGIFDKIYGIPPSVTSTLTDPTALVTFFSKEIEQGMKEMGYSIDWRRKFYTFDPPFNHFIQWQFRQLHAAGLIERGRHPVPWCPRDNQAVGGHDTRGDVDPELEEVVAVLFAAGEGFIPTITYRPETLPGVTNLWVNPSAKYVLCEQTLEKKKSDANGEHEAPWATASRKLYLSSEAFESLSHQLNLRQVRDVPSSELLALAAQHPLDGRSLPILPASFVKPEVGTGLVMSVPAHAPLDYLALRDAGKLDSIPPIQVLATPGFGACPAGELVQKMGVSSQTDPKSEEATKTLYKLEAHEGKMLSGAYAKMTGAQAKEKATADLTSKGQALALHVLAHAPVYCRCGARCTVRIVDNQWFINYGDEKWKEKARACLVSMTILPEGMRREFEYTIGWLKQKACTRSSGLGTRFPFDEKQLIEALSDSTIYMAYYTIAPVASKMKPEELTDAFFDYALLGKKPATPAGATEHVDLRWIAAREQFLYWYPLDSRHSAHDLIRNHLTFFIFIHTAVFGAPQTTLEGKSRPAATFWPRQTVSNGFVTMDGKKMSKSMGNILPLRKAIAQFGPDVVRFVVTSTAELEADSDFNQPAAEGVISRLQFLDEQLQKTLASKPVARDSAGQWFYSRFHRRLAAAPGQYARFELRPLAQAILYDTINDLQAYLKQSNAPDLREFFELWT
ncbi:MAG: leucine--tRNA ligase, partial [Candidatus Micrarchaeota archaeon]|nr:leucine--tRNA ligase [Candidatus Micrarchaeota archaeon]